MKCRVKRQANAQDEAVRKEISDAILPYRITFTPIYICTNVFWRLVATHDVDNTVGCSVAATSLPAFSAAKAAEPAGKSLTPGQVMYDALKLEVAP